MFVGLMSAATSKCRIYSEIFWLLWSLEKDDNILTAHTAKRRKNFLVSIINYGIYLTDTTIKYPQTISLSIPFHSLHDLCIWPGERSAILSMPNAEHHIANLVTHTQT